MSNKLDTGSLFISFMLNVEGEGLIHGIKIFSNTHLMLQCNDFSFSSIISKKK